MKNRTHWEELESTIVLPENSPIYSADEGMFIITEPITAYPIAGFEYVITWNGEQYTSICKETDDGFALGNMGLGGVGDDTGETFFIVLVPSDEMAATVGFYGIAVDATGLISTTLAIEGNIATIHKIDKKFLPDLNTNLVDGTRIGSLRTIGSTIESIEYVIGEYAFAEGRDTEASGFASHAEGDSTKASGVRSHAEGSGSIASGDISHAEGSSTKASGSNSHAEGTGSIASGRNSHVEGSGSIASGNNSHAEGSDSIASGESSHAEGNTIAIKYCSHAEGKGFDNHVILTGEANTKTYLQSGDYYGGIGEYVELNGVIAEITNIDGNNITLSETLSSEAIINKYAKLYKGAASGTYSHAEGYFTKANGHSSHAEGYNTKASNGGSHAEGSWTEASGSASHAEGVGTTASGDYSHAEGRYTIASGSNSHAEGFYTIAAGANQHAQGKNNIEDSNNIYAHIVGNGDGDENTLIRSNAHTLDWSGNAWFAGDVYVGSTSGINKDEGSKKLATEEYVNEKIEEIGTQEEIVQAVIAALPNASEVNY